MISLELFSELLEVLYSVPLRQERWGHFLDLLCEHTGSMSSFLLCANSRVGLSVQEQGGALWDSKILECYVANYSMNDPFRLPVARAGETGVKECDQLISYESFWASDFFRDIVQPAGARYATQMLLTVSLRRLEAVSVWRTPEQGQLTKDGSRLLQLLVPHVRSVLEIRYALGVVETQAKCAEAMADSSRTATFLLTEQGAVLHRNAAADAQLAEGDGLTVKEGVLMASSVRMRAPLRQLIRNAALSNGFAATPSPGQAMSLVRASARLPIQLLAFPAPQLQGGNRHAVLLLVTDPEKPVDVSDEMMRAYYGFTPAETEIANGLLTGYTLQEIAALRRVTVGTVRFQMKSLFAKTGTGRQADLIRKLLALPQMATIGVASLNDPASPWPVRVPN